MGGPIFQADLADLAASHSVYHCAPGDGNCRQAGPEERETLPPIFARCFALVSCQGLTSNGSAVRIDGDPLGAGNRRKQPGRRLQGSNPPSASDMAIWHKARLHFGHIGVYGD